MNNNEPKLVDIKGQEIKIGDFVMYPILTFLRCGLVYRIYNEKGFRAKYIPFYYNYGATPEEVVPVGAVRDQAVYKYERSVVKISQDELSSIISNNEFVALCAARDNIMRKLAKYVG